ncbi:3'(2'),5'-bisphosphate nucleotidase CysQ [Campylobacter sp. VicNov18]|uniref:3'(2'),5'-bisphosphate nucleotidase CysQ n=1 Tax=Campylobacter bilis TaxID=2691918 RepID=UPI00130E4E14|nr:inositol monophosphatase family protein [Campylobacter bilis]MPV64216.1 3'(2'),5'-bisphosphate nucleotidase CysQ [Campylobacter hepaticus]MBM0637720.1 3'(2'),5'-bisphosphate nucleotidase CysQ [Campylobacter bilis]MCC8278445.1 3'(2'),5'-bisphosphate nucleotidase CysQ [Campylobacter bilis]MCC8299949.1 3'(2'),5'-bisphosphate nucleotidase CysQ [Campylobacter bilis]MCC8301354.1 3'(2'),5'-bisphosphate nucleotidase CysQ [Campylobacter bilis]
MLNLDKLLSLAMDGAYAASKAILKERQDLKIWQKEDKSPLTSADLASNEILNEILRSSDIAILSEENLFSLEACKDLKYFWLIDPLDGTSGFLKGSDEFCVMISLVYEKRPVLSLIQNPSKGDIFYAHAKTKVYKNDKILSICDEKYEKNKFKALLSMNHLCQEDEAFAKEHQLQALNIGSGLKFCAILEAKAGVYKRFQSLYIWDIVAGDFLVNQNGGFMGDFSKKMLSYHPLDHKAKPFVCVSSKKFLQDFCKD